VKPRVWSLVGLRSKTSLDGTLWDSLPWYATIMSDGDASRFESLLEQLRSGASVVTLAGRRGLTKQQLARRCRKEAESLNLFPSVRETLCKLAVRGIPMGVVTSLFW
jgi:phosphoglycolate phosphatase-like HAD superfamily hydrolase